MDRRNVKVAPVPHDAQKRREEEFKRRERARALRPLTPSPPPLPLPQRQRFPWSDLYGQSGYPVSGQLGHYVPAPPQDKPSADSAYGTASYQPTATSQYPVGSYYPEFLPYPVGAYYGNPGSYNPYSAGSYYPYGYPAASLYPTAQPAAAAPPSHAPPSHAPIVINNNVFQGGPDEESSPDSQPQDTLKQGTGPRRHAEPDVYLRQHPSPSPSIISVVPGATKRAATPSKVAVKETDEPHVIINNNIYNMHESDSEYASDIDADKRPDRTTRPAMRKHLRKDKAALEEPEKPLSFRLNPLAPQDITVHMSLDATDDLEGVLEEHSKLRRLGHFNAAMAHFEDHLEHFLDNKYVLVQHGQCLLEAKRYRQLANLAKDYPPKPSEEAMQLSWSILLQKAEVESALEFPVLQDTSKLVKSALSLVQASWPRLDSTEMQILAHSISLSDVFVTWIEPGKWKLLYEYLQADGLIWEFRDLFLELEQLVGAEEALRMLIDGKAHKSSAEELIDRLHADWDGQDESSVYALIDIFASLGLAFIGQPAHESGRRKCLDLAEKHVRVLVSDDDEMAHCRPCLRYVMAMVLIELHDEPGKRHGSISFPDHRRGDLLLSRHVFPAESLPIYAPIEDEAPTWLPSKTDPDDELPKIKTEATLELAEKLGDVEMQAACLQELMYQGEEEAEYALEKLEHLWLSVGCMMKVHQTQLFRYMLVRTPPDREQLRRDMLTGGEFGFAGFWEGYAQYMVLRALTPKAREKEVYLARAEAMKMSIRQLRESRGTPGYQRAMPLGESNGKGAQSAGKAMPYNDWRSLKLSQINRNRSLGDGPKANDKAKGGKRNVVRGDKNRGAAKGTDEDEDPRLRLIRQQIERDQKETRRLQRRTARMRQDTEALEKETEALRRLRWDKTPARRGREWTSSAKHNPRRAEVTFSDEEESGSHTDGESHLSRAARVDDYEGSSDREEGRFKGDQPELVPERVPGQLMIGFPGYDGTTEGRDGSRSVSSSGRSGSGSGSGSGSVSSGSGSESRSRSRSRGRSIGSGPDSRRTRSESEPRTRIIHVR